MILITGERGTLGSELKKLYPEATNTLIFGVDIAYLCGGTKGFHECDGSEDIFWRDVDGNIHLIKALLKTGAFVVFISTEAVAKIGHRAAYSSNRLLVEQFLWPLSSNAIIRPRRFDKTNAPDLAAFCKRIGEGRQEGIHYWP